MSTPYRDLLAALPAQPKTWLVTGVAGFIGSNLFESLLERDQTVAGLDHRPRQPPGPDLGNPAVVNQVYTVAVGERTTLNALFEAIRETLPSGFPASARGPKEDILAALEYAAIQASHPILIAA